MNIFVTSTSAHFRVQDLVQSHTVVWLGINASVLYVEQDKRGRQLQQMLFQKWSFAMKFVLIIDKLLMSLLRLLCNVLSVLWPWKWYNILVFQKCFDFKPFPVICSNSRWKFAFPPNTTLYWSFSRNLPMQSVVEIKYNYCYMLTIVLPTEGSDQFIVSDWESCLTTESQGQSVHIELLLENFKFNWKRKVSFQSWATFLKNNI